MEEEKKVKREGLIVPYPDSRWEKPLHTGYMTKCGSKFKTWRKRFFVLTSDGKMWYFKNKKSKKPKNEIPVHVNEMRYSLSDRKRFCIKVERYPIPFFFFAENVEIRDLWMEKLREAGGIYSWFDFTENKSIFFCKDVPENVKELTTNEFRTWSPQQLQVYLQQKRLDFNRRFSEYSKNFNGLSGKDIPNLINKGFILEDKNISENDRKEIVKDFTSLMNLDKRFDYDCHVVTEKIFDMLKPYGTKYFGGPDHRWSFLARALSDPELLALTYLNPNVEYFDFDQYIGSGRSSDPTTTTTNKKKEEEEEEEGEGDDNIKSGNDDRARQDDSLQGNEKSKVWEKKREEFKIPVKLILRPRIVKHSPQSARYDLLRPLLCYTPPTTTTSSNNNNNMNSVEVSEEEMVVVVIIGRWYLCFEKPGLCIPRTIHSEMARLIGDHESMIILKNRLTFMELCVRIARTICEWNVTKVFHTSATNQKLMPSTSVDFAFAILQSLSISSSPSSPYFTTVNENEPYFQFLKKENEPSLDGSSSLRMNFTPSQKFKEKFLLKEETYKFKTHKELDDFMKKCIEVDELMFRVDYKSETRILFEFDRIFWFLHLKDKGNEKYKPTETCVFDDPLRLKGFVDHGYDHWKGNVYNS